MEEGGQRAQLVAAYFIAVQCHTRQGEGVHHLVTRPGMIMGLVGASEETDVETGVVRDEHR